MRGLMMDRPLLLSAIIEHAGRCFGSTEIAMAAVIGVHHPKWQERPLLICVRVPGSEIGADEILAFLSGKITKWWMPDDVQFVDALPMTGTGKIHKLTLREQFEDYRLPGT